MNPLSPLTPKFSTAHIAALTLAAALQTGFSDKAAAAIAPRNSTVTTVAPSQDALRPFFGQHSTYLSVQEANRINNAKKGDQLAARSIEFLPTKAPSELPQNGLWLFYNDASGLKKTLGKTFVEITGFSAVTNENIEQIVEKAFNPTDDRSWLRKTVGTKKVAYTDAEYELYTTSVLRTQWVLTQRLKNPLFRSYAIERSNVFISQIASQGELWPKTLQAVFVGIMGLADIAENAKNPALTTDRMKPFEWATQVARLARLTDWKAPTLQYYITVASSREKLKYSLAQKSKMEDLFWDPALLDEAFTKVKKGMTAKQVYDHFLKTFNKSLLEIGVKE